MPAILREFSYRMLAYRRTWRRSLVMNLLNPLLFFVGIGFGLGQLIDDSDLPGGYLAFLAPGLLVASAVQTAVIETGGSTHTSLRERGTYRAALMTPMGPGDIFYGQLLFIACRVTLAATAVLTVMACAGTVAGPAGILAVPVAVLTAMSLALPAMLMALTVGNQTLLWGVLDAALMTLFLFGGTFVPVEQMPGPVQPIVAALPLTVGVTLARELTTGVAEIGPSLGRLAVLALICVGGLVLTRLVFQRVLRD